MKTAFKWPATRWQAFRVHLASSLVIGTLFALVTLLLWYPQPLLVLQGGLLVIGVLLGVDAILGPMMTLLVFSPRKARAELRLDLATIVALQFAAFSYGAWVIYSERPQYLVFAQSQFFVVNGPETVGLPEAESFEKSMRFGLLGPRVVYAAIPAEHVASGSALISALLGDPSFALDATTYRPFPHNLSHVRAEAMASQEVLSELGDAPEKLAKSAGLAVSDLLFFQIKGKKSSGIAVVDQKTGALIGIIAVDLRQKESPTALPERS